MTTLAAAAMLAGCGGEVAPVAVVPGPRVDVATLPADRLVAAVLDACHRPLLGRMKRLSAVLRVAGTPDEWRLFAELPARLRAQSPTSRLLLRDGSALRLDGELATGAEAARLRQFALALEVASLGPLHRSRGCERLGPRQFSLDCDDASTWQVEFAPDALEPCAFVADGVRVAIVDAQRTASSWVVRAVEVPGLGRCAITLEDSDIAWSDDFFAPVKRTTPASAPRVTRPTRLTAPGAEPRSPVPIVVDGRELRLVLLPDPGDWPGRAERYRAVHDELVRQEQQIAGFGALLHDDGGVWLAVPFRQRPGKPPLAAPADWRIEDHAAGRWLVCYPAEGDCAERIATGEARLRDALATQHLQPRGPILAQPFLHLEAGAPDAPSLQDLTVRLAVPIE